MASILDQYEHAQAARVPASRTIQEPVMPGSGFIDARPKEEKPIFSKKKIDFKPKSAVTHVAACNNFLVMTLIDGTVMRMDLAHPEQQEEVELFKGTEDKVNKIFLDPTGRHLIMSMASTENLYLSRNSKKPRPISKLKGHLISCVGWNWQNTNDSTTGAILLGTSTGLVFETELSANTDSRLWQGNLDQYLKQLYQIQPDSKEVEPVTGIEFDRMPSDSMTEYQYFILITTPGKLYQFLGSVSKTAEPPLFAQLFNKFDGGDQMPSFHQLPGEFGRSELRLFFSSIKEPPKKFAWMTGPGIFHGDIDLSGQMGPHQVLSNQKLIRYPKDGESKNVQEKPMGIVMTEFHVVLLYPDRLTAFCLLNEELICDDSFQDLYGRLVGIVKDPLKGTVWVHTSQNIFKYYVHNESRDVWQMYLDKEEFELAKTYCKDNPVQLDKVLTKQAEFLFKGKRFEESAEMYAKTQCSFEEVALRFIRLEDKNALRKFLHTKLETLRLQDKTQTTMLVTWLTEIYLNQLGEMREQNQEGNPSYKSLQNDFQSFLRLSRIKECVSDNRAVIYDLIASHGDVEDLVFFAFLMQDYEKVISHYLQYDNYKSALSMLTKQTHPELYYKFSPVFMQYIPHDTVEAWKSQKSLLDPKRLIPALVQYDDGRHRDQGNEVISYLEFCINQLKNKDQAIHNYLVALYAKLKPGRLMDYFISQETEDVIDDDDLCYDLKYALRLCSEHGHKKECVYIYSRMGLYEEAVDLALTLDVEQAKTVASKPSEEDVELQRKLWLKIAQHVVQEEKNVKKAMEFLHECELLKIEDILPFFPDFVTIDHFKDAIIESLEEYNQHIDQLKVEMEEATESAEEIRREIQGFRNKYAQVKAQDKCFKCNFPLMTRAFYLFPCHHKFHSDCLIEEILPNLSPKSRDKVQELQSRLAERDESKQSKPDAALASAKQKIKSELDDLVASECIYCGKYMIMSIDKPFFDGTDEEEEGWM